MSVWGLVILGLVRTGSLGFAGDPLAGGVSFKLGADKGFRGHLILSFGSGENRVDSAEYVWQRENDYRERKTEYSESFWRPYSWTNLGVRAEYYFASKGWYQPYVGIGVGWKKESRWMEKWETEDTVETVTPELTEAEWLGPVGVIGVDFYPIPLASKILDLKIPFAKAISFNIEICPFYLVKHEFKGDPYNEWWWYYYPERKFSGISAGAGIHFNF